MIATVRDVARGGFGVVAGLNGPVMIPRVLTGEKIRFKISHHRHGVDWGTAEEILCSSPHRVPPPCPHYNHCGGCNLQHAAPDHQLEIKTGILRGNLKRIAGMDPAPQPAIKESPPFHYRTRMVLQIRQGKAGFFHRGSHRLVAVATCPLMPPAMQARMQELAGHPRIKNLDEGQLVLLSNGEEVSASLVENGQWFDLAGPSQVTFRLPAGDFTVAPRNFVQANLFTMPAMQALALPLGKGISTGADLYAGAGFLTLAMARRCTQNGWAVESDHHNLKMLRFNLEVNGLEHIQTMGKHIADRHWPRVDFVVSDPPRKGIPFRVIDSLGTAPPMEMVMFSCDSATFSRDLGRLIKRGFTLIESALIDNFPQSDHMEIAARLRGPAKMQG